MSTQEVAKRFTDLCKSGAFDEAGKQFWSDHVLSIEAMPGEMARLEGRKAVEAKGKWWSDNNTVHGAKVEGPFVNGEVFALRFEFDVTPKGKPRATMIELGLYTVKGDKVVEERFLYGE